MAYAGLCHNGPLDGKNLAHMKPRYWLEHREEGALGHYLHVEKSWVWVPTGEREPDISR
jgi:hypothetical protein